MINTERGFSSMVLRVQTGVDEAGSAVFKDKSYSRVLPTASQEDLYAVAEALMSLSSWSLHHVQRVDREDLIRIS
jgi:hypothetical protein